jgi:hypothetical protein
MNSRTLWTRVALTAFYFAATFCYLYYFSRGETSCQDVNGYPVETIRLAIGCTAWSLFASLCAAIALHRLNIPKSAAGFISFAVALVGFISIPYWIYLGYGHFRFENTSADVSCFFREGFGIVFPIIVAPVLAGLTLLCEYLAHRIPPATHPPHPLANQRCRCPIQAISWLEWGEESLSSGVTQGVNIIGKTLTSPLVSMGHGSC